MYYLIVDRYVGPDTWAGGAGDWSHGAGVAMITTAMDIPDRIFHKSLSPNVTDALINDRAHICREIYGPYNTIDDARNSDEIEDFDIQISVDKARRDHELIVEKWANEDSVMDHWNAEGWILGGGGYDWGCEHLGITEATTDDELDSIADKIDTDARYDKNTIVFDTRRFLGELRDHVKMKVGNRGNHAK